MEDIPSQVTQKTGSWTPKKENWESEIASIDTVERDRDTGKLWAFIYFNNNKRSKVGMEMVYKHCPIAMLKFYEQHLLVLIILPQRSPDLFWVLPERSPKLVFCIEADQMWRKIGNSMPEDEISEEK